MHAVPLMVGIFNFLFLINLTSLYHYPPKNPKITLNSLYYYPSLNLKITLASRILTLPILTLRGKGICLVKILW